ncbi:MAG TPA: hypothetical protein VFI21_08055 [Nocardioides sp.]|nr:hypothetical protein [Nocardioides sp.]
MAEHLLDHLDVGARGDGKAGGGVPELVGMQPGNTDGLGCVVEGLAEGAHTHRRPAAYPGEHEVVRTPADNEAGELGREERRKRDLTPLMRLGSSPHEAMSLHRSHGGDDRGTVPDQVESVDAEGSHLAEPDAGVGEEEDEEPVGLVGAGVVACVLVGIARVATGTGEVLDLVVGQVPVLVLADAREVDTLGHVACQPPVLDRHVEDETEHAVDLGHTGRRLTLGEGRDPGLDVGVRHPAEPDPSPLRADVLADDPGVPLVGGRLEVGLATQPPVGPGADGDLCQSWVDVGAGELGALHRRQEPLGVDLAGERLVALGAGRCSVVGSPYLLPVPDALLDAGHVSSSVSRPTRSTVTGRAVGGWSAR